jgi:hypothetical protein
MSGLIANTSVTVPKDPRDRLSGYVVAWGLWVLVGAVIEAKALYEDRLHHDRVKRTFSSNLRSIFATDSVTGIPLDVRFGKTRRFLLTVAVGPGWLPAHLTRKGYE